jgi:endogenous inhibitor of DNA gyrase (YacG/DUF329 family)
MDPKLNDPTQPCPECKVGVMFINRPAPNIGRVWPPKWQCPRCGHSAALETRSDDQPSGPTTAQP